MSERFSAGIAYSDLFGDNYSVMNTTAVSRWVEEVYPRYRQRLADALRIRESELSRYERALGMPEARVFALLLDHYERDSAANFTEWANSMIRNAGSTSAAQFWSQAYRTFNRLVQEYQGAKQMHPAVTSAGAQFMPGYRAFPYAKSYTSNLNIPSVGQLAAAQLLLNGNKETKKESTTKETKESTTHQELVPVAPSPSAQEQAKSALAPYKETLGKMWDAAVRAGTALARSAGGRGLGAAAAAWIVKQIMGYGASGDDTDDTHSLGRQEASVKIEQVDDHQELVPVAPSPSAQKQAMSALAPYKETLGKMWDAAVQVGTALARSAGGTGLGAAAAAWIVKQIMGYGASGDNTDDTHSQWRQEASVKIEQVDDEPNEETKTILKIEEGSPRSIWDSSRLLGYTGFADSSPRLLGYTGFAGGSSKRRMPFQSPRKFIGGSYSWDLPKLIKLKTRKLAGAGIKKKSRTLATKTKSKTRRK